MERSVPVEINHMREKGVVRVTWDDGHVGEYSREYLRGYCPCALGPGEGGGAGSIWRGGGGGGGGARDVGRRLCWGIFSGISARLLPLRHVPGTWREREIHRSGGVGAG